jgi:putative peptide modification system cyclase
MLAIGIAFGAWFLLQSPPTLPLGQRDWVVVGDLHNLTGDPRFDQSVDTALHISLEQSQYVNVLPELSVQQTLQRMERNPDKTAVNRAIGSEIALRDGARALILPTLAEVGGRVRVTAEVVDPNTQTTVYSVSADGTGAQSVLPSLDSVSKQLRGKLGEALAMVSKESQPLDKVATSNLDALRAYSLAVNAESIGKMQEAFDFYKQAISIDQNFALAHVGLGRALATTGRNEEAEKEIKIAEGLRSRLSTRDSLYVDAWLASFEQPREMLKKWKLLIQLYPDFFPASGAYAYFAWRDANDFQDAIQAARTSASPRNPHRATSQFLLGDLLLENEQYSDSIASFIEAEHAGVPLTDYLATAYAATRKFREADAALTRNKPFSGSLDDADLRINKIAFALDQGDLSRVKSVIDSAPQDSSRSQNQMAFVSMSLHSMLGPRDATLKELAQIAISGEPTAKAQYDRVQHEMNLLLGAYLSAKLGDEHLAQRFLGAGANKSDLDDFPVLHNMYGVAQAELLTSRGDAKQAVEYLRPLLSGKELYITHVALMDAYSSLSDRTSALAEAHWLATHRGRAYAEYNSHWTLKPLNILESNLAWLASAEFSIELNNEKEARQSLAFFLRIWPLKSQPTLIATRTRRLQAMLSSPKD